MTRTTTLAEPRMPMPMWIPTPNGSVFAFYHPPTTPQTRRMAVLLCDPFGWNRMVLHLTYRRLALRLADAGFPVLRVDHPGTCDSEGSPRQLARVESWLGSLDVAADRLKTWSGARDLAVCGVLLGGTLGVMLAARRRDVTALALWGPYLQGRAAVRAGIAGTTTGNSNPEGREPSTAVEGDQEALGFLLTKGMLSDLSSIDLLNISPRSVRNALILPRTATSPEPRLAQHLARLGTAVDLHETASDDLETILQSEGVGNPTRTIEQISAWLVHKSPELVTAAPVDAAQICPSKVILNVPGRRQIRESAVRFGSDGAIFGILSEPLGEVRKLSILFVNGGANHRSGVNRNYTEWARTLAARGHRVLRMDVRGLGDSPPPSPDAAVALYRHDARQDVLDAIAWLRGLGSSEVACVGLCAGGCQAFQAALTDPSIASVVMLNPLRFHEPLPMLSGDLLEARRWRRAIRRNRSAGQLIRSAKTLALELIHLLLPWANRADRASRRIARSFVELTEHGVDLRVIYNDNEPTLDFVRRSLRPVERRLASSGRFRIETVGHADHIYSPLWIQEQVGNLLNRYLDELAARASRTDPALDPEPTAEITPQPARQIG